MPKAVIDTSNVFLSEAELSKNDLAVTLESMMTPDIDKRC